MLTPQVWRVVEDTIPDVVGHLVGTQPTVEDRIRAAAAVGTIRLSLEQPGVEPEVHRARIVGRAMLLMQD